MYWWNASKLAKDLREGRVDERERLKYFLATVVAWNVGALLLFYSGGNFSSDHLIYAALCLTIAAVGTILCYRVNKSGDDTDFVGRMVCLGWPVGALLTVMWLVPSIVSAWFDSISPDTPGLASFLSTVVSKLWEHWRPFFRNPVLWSLFALVYYFILYLQVRDVAHGKPNENLGQPKETAWSRGKVATTVVAGTGVPMLVIVMTLLGAYGKRVEPLAALAVGLWLLLFVAVLVWMDRTSRKTP